MLISKQRINANPINTLLLADPLLSKHKVVFEPLMPMRVITGKGRNTNAFYKERRFLTQAEELVMNTYKIDTHQENSGNLACLKQRFHLINPDNFRQMVTLFRIAFIIVTFGVIGHTFDRLRR